MFIDRAIVYPDNTTSTEALDTAGDICLRKFRVGSRHNGIEPLAARRAAAAIRINVSSRVLGRFSVAAVVLRTVELGVSNRCMRTGKCRFPYGRTRWEQIDGELFIRLHSIRSSRVICRIWKVGICQSM